MLLFSWDVSTLKQEGHAAEGISPTQPILLCVGHLQKWGSEGRALRIPQATGACRKPRTQAQCQVMSTEHNAHYNIFLTSFPGLRYMEWECGHSLFPQGGQSMLQWSTLLFGEPPSPPHISAAGLSSAQSILTFHWLWNHHCCNPWYDCSPSGHAPANFLLAGLGTSSSKWMGIYELTWRSVYFSGGWFMLKSVMPHQ